MDPFTAAMAVQTGLSLLGPLAGRFFLKDRPSMADLPDSLFNITGQFDNMQRVLMGQNQAQQNTAMAQAVANSRRAGVTGSAASAAQLPMLRSFAQQRLQLLGQMANIRSNVQQQQTALQRERALSQLLEDQGIYDNRMRAFSQMGAQLGAGVAGMITGPGNMIGNTDNGAGARMADQALSVLNQQGVQPTPIPPTGAVAPAAGWGYGQNPGMPLLDFSTYDPNLVPGMGTVWG